MALLHWLVENGYRRLIVCHLDHRLRGRSSAADARFVRRLADEYELEFEGAETDVRGFARDHRQSIETAARTARYAFFLEVARRRRCRTIFLGHHADDLVETFLFNLFRGTGGGRIMRPVSNYSLGKTALTIVRPLLHVWRAEVDRYLTAAGLKFREDASNARLDATRNRMRHKIIPALEKEFGRNIRQSLWRAATIAADEEEWLATLVPPTAEARELGTELLRAEPIALQRRIVRAWLRQHEVAEVSFDLIERVRALAAPDAPVAKTNLPGDRHARRRAKKIFIDG
ncbi:MAG: tRNA lysidine(34) synthetase TilS [Verrucomicrobiota bacterium]|nr:tRNA lysidine(34) synthetase TilS [Verrucomicrobiota bacterium]